MYNNNKRSRQTSCIASNIYVLHVPPHRWYVNDEDDVNVSIQKKKTCREKSISTMCIRLSVYFTHPMVVCLACRMYHASSAQCYRIERHEKRRAALMFSYAPHGMCVIRWQLCCFCIFLFFISFVSRPFVVVMHHLLWQPDF